MSFELSAINANQYEKALPEPTPLTKPFWDYCKKHEFRMQYCSRCSEWIWYPKPWCPNCGKRDSLDWRIISGKGKVYSYTVIRQVIDNSPAFQKDLPFLIGLVELDEGPRIYSNITNVEVDKLSIGDQVTIFFEDVSSDYSLPKFKKT
jgi:uncharacterized OB-fold protein